MSEIKTTEKNSAAESNGSWGSWFSNVQNTAKDLAIKAQEMAEVAAKLASEKAEALVHQAQEMRQNYDMEVATSILMSSVGASNLENSRNRDEQIGSQYNRLNSTIRELDLNYVTENVVSMAFPFDPKTCGPNQVGNDINTVAKFLRKRHGGQYMVWNISEESYDYTKFGDQVLEYKFPGHPAPPLGLLFKICTSVESWLDADERNIAIVHCLTGKGRTSVMIACILTWIGEFPSPVEALQYVADRRTIHVDYLTIPSQRRYLQYFSNMLDGIKPRSEPLLLRRVIINGIPVFGKSGDSESTQGCCPYIQLFKNGKLIATATPSDNEGAVSHPTSSESKPTSSKLQLRWVYVIEGSASFSIDCAVQGDVLLRCRHAAVSGDRVSMFRAGFHTGYVPSGVLRLTKAQLDGSNTDSRFDENFFIDLIFAPITIPTKSTTTSTATTPSNTASSSKSTATTAVETASSSISYGPNDAGLLLDAISSDKYEMSIHKDGRFWEAITARKVRSKKRRARKFLSTQHEQFSIGDDPLKQSSLDDDNTMEIDFSSGDPTVSSAEKGDSSSSNKISNMSDLELIMQLARATELDPDDEDVSSKILAPSDDRGVTEAEDDESDPDESSNNVMEMSTLQENKRKSFQSNPPLPPSEVIQRMGGDSSSNQHDKSFFETPDFSSETASSSVLANHSLGIKEDVSKQRGEDETTTVPPGVPSVMVMKDEKGLNPNNSMEMNSELMELEAMEKDKPLSVVKESIPPPIGTNTEHPVMQSEDDELDELEQYLLSLNATHHDE